MKLARCPVCHSDIHLDQLLEDEAGRDLLRIITETKYEVARPLVSYIALFRPAKSALSNSRAVKLMNEVLAMYQPSHLLAHALSEAARKRNHEVEERHNAILYIERMKGLGQDITQLSGYEVWLDYQQRKQQRKQQQKQEQKNGTN